MTYPAFDTSHLAETIEAPTGLVTCSSCGCRLDPVVDDGTLSWFHFATPAAVSSPAPTPLTTAGAALAADGPGRERPSAINGPGVVPGPFRFPGLARTAPGEAPGTRYADSSASIR